MQRLESVVLGELDVIGVNAFYPLAERDGASFDALLEGGEKVQARVRDLAETWQKPVFFTEIGYTTRRDPAIRPWEWPDAMKDVVVDEVAQADAYRALVAPLLDEPRFMGSSSARARAVGLRMRFAWFHQLRYGSHEGSGCTTKGVDSVVLSLLPKLPRSVPVVVSPNESATTCP
jgi:hypothetical protein